VHQVGSIYKRQKLTSNLSLYMHVCYVKLQIAGNRYGSLHFRAYCNTVQQSGFLKSH